MVAPLADAHPASLPWVVLCDAHAAGRIAGVVGHWRPGGGSRRHSLRGIPFVASGTGPLVCQRRWQARTTTQPRLPERGAPGRGGTGLISSLFLGWLAGVKRAEVETAVALPASGAVDHAMLVVELVVWPSRAGHECSRSIDASRAALRRSEVRQHIEHFWVSGTGHSLGTFSGRARGFAGKGCVGGLEARSTSGASCATGGLDG